MYGGHKGVENTVALKIFLWQTKKWISHGSFSWQSSDKKWGRDAKMQLREGGSATGSGNMVEVLALWYSFSEYAKEFFKELGNTL